MQLNGPNTIWDTDELPLCGDIELSDFSGIRHFRLSDWDPFGDGEINGSVDYHRCSPCTPLEASDPSPPDGAVCVDPNVVLSWSPGCCADWHDVYFGNNFDDVDNADTTTPGVYKGRQSRGNETYTPGHLEKCTTYYWRVDEICEDSIVAEPPDPAHLLAHYKFENNADDSSGNSFHGTVMGDTTYEPGVSGQAISLDGDGDYVDLGNPAALNFGTGDWTVSMWIKTTESDKGVLFANGGGGAGGIHYALVVGESQNDKITLSVDDDQDRVQAHSSTNVTDGEWHCVAGVRDGDTLRVYVDCELEGTADLPAGYDLSGTVQHNALIGAIWNHGTNTIENYFNGLIDDLRIYDYALSHEEVRYVCDCRDLIWTETYKGEVWSFTTEGCPCECLSIRVSQESSPGLGDFDENVLGCIKVFETADSAKDYYAYDTCGDSFGNVDFINQHGLIAGRSHLFLVCGCDGLSLFIVHDKPDCAPGPNNPNDGRAEMRFGLLGDPNGARRTVEDDPTAMDPYDAYTPALGEWGTIFGSQHKWYPGRTDGEAITGLDGEDWSMLVEFTEYDSNSATPVIGGLNSWFAYSEDGSTIELDLEADRRVRLDCCIPECNILEYRCRGVDVKWSQPPVEVNEGIINGWDEVSALGFSFDCWACPTQCHGDADCSNQGPFQVSLSDLNILTDAMGTRYGDPDYNPCADFNRDWKVDEADEVILYMRINRLNIPADCQPELGRVIADDWLCKDERPIKGIHWWGSFKGWTEPNCAPPPEEMPDAFHIGIWTDVPDPDPCDTNTFSHPGELVWEKISDCYVWSFAGYDLDPRGIDGNDACFKFDQLLSQDEWFYQNPNGGDGTVYWLSIAAICDGNTPEYPWGWKTRPHFYSDDAVHIATLDGGEWPPAIGSVWESGEPIQYPEGTSWDMAFVLTANRKYMPRRRRWPRTSWTVREELMAADIYEDGRIDFKDLAVSANYWLEEAVWP